ncbi:MAG: Holliday junction resolvase RuvX [Bacilli bacterium]|nr:Holliday junction resolvase RuvX [Acholeplasmataceae bacterium]MDY2902533.1 Holliday junction resolvase RuvX [Bacilli bacterium]
MRILGLDLGSKTVGMAVSDYLGIIANPIGTLRIEENNLEQALELVKEEVKKQGAEKIVLGLPKNMNGSIGFQAEYCLKFKEMLENEIKLPVIMIDERMTSTMANNIMLKADMSRNKRKQNVDKLAATIILQSYLDSMPK